MDVAAWEAQVVRNLETVHRAVGTLIDRGVDDRWLPEPRQPDVKTKVKTDRPDGIFRSTPTSPGRTGSISDPTPRAVEAWETAVQQAATVVLELVGEAHTLVDTFRLAVPQPAVPPLQHHDATYTTPERWTVDLPPERCRLWTRAAIAWLTLVTVKFGAVWPSELDIDRADGHAQWWQQTCARAARRLDDKPAVQKQLIWCKQHPDVLAKYRKRELCESCYRAERKTG